MEASAPGGAPLAASQHFTRSKVAGKEFKAAGVLPFTLSGGGREVLCLLGGELVRTGPKGKVQKQMWSDFGGKREAIDADVESNASREFAEETLGLFGDCSVTAAGVRLSADHMAHQLRARAHVLHVKHALRSGSYHMFIALLPHIEEFMFMLATQQNLESNAIAGAEKTAFAWVPLAKLLSATRTCAPRYFLCCAAAVSGLSGRRPTRARRRMQLHPCFAASLRLAAASGLAALVAAARAERCAALPRLRLQRGPGPPAWAALQPAAASAAGGAGAAAPAGARSPAEEARCGCGDEAACDERFCLYASSCSYWLAQDGVAAALQLRCTEQLPPPPLLPPPPAGQGAVGGSDADAWRVAAVGLAALGYARAVGASAGAPAGEGALVLAPAGGAAGAASGRGLGAGDRPAKRRRRGKRPPP